MDTFARYNKNKLLRERCEQWSLRRQNKMAAALELVTDSLPPVGYGPRTPTPAPAWLQRLMSLNSRFFGGEKKQIKILIFHESDARKMFPLVFLWDHPWNEVTESRHLTLL